MIESPVSEPPPDSTANRLKLSPQDSGHLRIPGGDHGDLAFA